MLGHKIFTENPRRRSARGNIFQEAMAARGSGTTGEGRVAAGGPVFKPG